MSSHRIGIALVMALSLTATAAKAGQTWLGAQIMPKSEQLLIEARGEKEHSGGIYEMAWPAVVSKTNGRWLYIEDEGGYSNPPVAGWVYADDVLRLENAADHYTSELQANKSATLYWLRGICWENKAESLIALGDYHAAEVLNPNLDDVQIRLGRLLARRTLKSGTVRYVAKQRSIWEQHFANAQRANPNRAQLYLDWGMALGQACKCGVTTNQTKMTAAAMGEEASDVATQTDLAADAADRAATLANKEINDALAAHQKKGSDDFSKAQSEAEAAGGSGNTAQAAAVAAETAAQVALDAAMHAAEFGAPLPASNGTDPTAVQVKPEFKEEDIAIAEANWKGAKKYLQSVNRARAAATIARQAAIRGWLRADSTFRMVDKFPAIEPSTAMVAEPIPAPNGTGFDANAEPFTAASQCFDMAAAKSPNWWRIPIARGEFLINQCAVQNRLGETGWNDQESVDLLNRLIACNTKNSTQTSSDADQPSDPKIQSMELAIRLFDDALQLNPNSPDAYRDRAEALRLEAQVSAKAHQTQAAKGHLAAALESATTACALGNYRQTGSLRTLAEITHDLKLNDSAADYAEKAYACSSLEDRPATEKLFDRYYALVAPQSGGKSAGTAGATGAGFDNQILIAGGPGPTRGAGPDNGDSPEQAESQTTVESRPQRPAGFMFRAP